MFIRAYLRASTAEQDANRARATLEKFANDNELRIAKFYVENESGAKLERPRLNELLEDCSEGDILLIEDIDRLTRLKADDWEILRNRIAMKKIKIVAVNVPTTHMQMNNNDFTAAILSAVNTMLIELLATVARRDYEQRRERQAQGIEKAKAQKKYTGKKPNIKKYELILNLLDAGHSYAYIHENIGASPVTISRAKKWREERKEKSASNHISNHT